MPHSAVILRRQLLQARAVGQPVRDGHAASAADALLLVRGLSDHAVRTQRPPFGVAGGRLAPTNSTVGGPDSYWHTYDYDDGGNRTKQIQHATTSGTSTVTRTYTPNEPAASQAHALHSITTSGSSDDGTETFGYDDARNTTTRKGGGADQTLTWDAEGHLETVTAGGKTTEYLYDSSGNRMSAKQADGSTTAYLPAGNELTVTAAGTKQATRYYTHNSETVAARTAAGFTFLFGDHQGTALIAVAFGTGQGVTRRKQLPFGGQRSSTGSTSWPGDRGFLGGTSDPTGYTHLGAREYDPATGRFFSVAPLMTADDPRQHNAYQYGNNLHRPHRPGVRKMRFRPVHLYQR
jgi:RHS repeat-associated protein